MSGSTASTPLATTLSPELRALSTWVSRPRRREVTAESVRRFVAATRAGQSFETVGAAGPSQAVELAPATYFCPDPVVEVEALGLVRPRSPERSIDAGSRWAPATPVRVGDRLTSIGRVTEVVARKTRDGRDLVETRFEIMVWNQRGESSGVAGGTILNYEDRPA